MKHRSTRYTGGDEDALAALRPVRVPGVRDVQAAALRGLVLGWRLADALAATSRERFALRAWALGAWALGTAFRLLGSRSRRLTLPPRRRGRWSAAQGVAMDIETLSQEGVETYRALEVSLGSHDGMDTPPPR